MQTYISLKFVLASLIVIATVVYGQCEKLSIPKADKEQFKFYKQSYYKDLFKAIEPRPLKCITVGKFASAGFNIKRGGVVTMYEKSECRGVSKDRKIPGSSMPGNNMKDYGILFESIRYTPNP
ncbi:hypothetical protein AYI69_g5444 [Smittium culicis]|uniref:Uncharacterized protein n=1 Tax=Smittium culicis TaxID=133412 RepID=A0A1R1Y5W4_9FUNG|nr:hypothetical protein AYI69_g5444 [Smittium culicis]